MKNSLAIAVGAVVLLAAGMPLAQNTKAPASKTATANATSPGFFMTELNAAKMPPERKENALRRTPMGRWGKTPELVGAAVYLASPSAGFVTGTVVKEGIKFKVPMMIRVRNQGAAKSSYFTVGVRFASSPAISVHRTVSGIGDRGSGIRDQGSGIGDRGSGIRDQGSGVGGRSLIPDPRSLIPDP